MRHQTVRPWKKLMRESRRTMQKDWQRKRQAERNVSETDAEAFIRRTIAKANRS